jgi:hypothetical protein
MIYDGWITWRTYMRIIRLFLVPAVIATAAFAADADPFLGKWKLNWGKSRSSEPAPKSAVRKYTKHGEGVRVSEDWVEVGGKHMKLDYIAAYDGKDYPVASSKGATVAFTHTDPFTVEGVSKVNGKVSYTFKRVVSPDRKTLTIEMAKNDAEGKASPIVLVYEKM